MKVSELIKLPKNHKPERGVKSAVAANFYIDGNLFIERCDLVARSESMGNRYFRAKCIVDLLMSIECSLKCFVISLSKDDETPTQAYKKARSCSHSLEKLYSEVELRARGRFRLDPKRQKIFDDLKALGVGSRYALEVWMLRVGSQSVPSVDQGLVSRTIDDGTWSNEVRKVAVQLNNAANRCRMRFLADHGTLTGKRFNAYDQALATFLSHVK